MLEIRRRSSMYALTCVLAICGWNAAHAQSAPDADALETEPEAASATVRRVGPTIIFLQDEEGVLQPSPDLTLEELRDLVRSRDERPDPEDAPQFHYAEADINGTADKNKVTLDINYAVVVHERRWVRVPLQLAGAVIVQSSIEGAGSHFIEYDEQRGSYFAWLKPDAVDETYRIKLKILERISKIGDESRIELQLPRVVATRRPPEMTLRVPVERAVATASSAAQTSTVEAVPQGKSTLLRVTQPVGDFALSWRSTKIEAASQAPVVFDAASKIIVQWDSQSRVVWDATIDLSVRQGELSSAEVKLPPGVRPLADEVPGQRIVTSGSSDGSESPTLLVEFDRPGQSKQIKLSCERIVAPQDGVKSAPIEIAAFEVVGAARQSGHIGIITSATLQANLEPGPHIYRQYQMPPGFRDAGVVGSMTFQFLSQPCSLKMSVSPRERRIAASPVYVLRVNGKQLSLSAHIRYRVTGAWDACRTIFPGWDIKRIELIEGDTSTPLDFAPPTESTLDVNLPRSMRGEFQLHIEASQPMASDGDFLAVNLPSVEADVVETPQLVTVPAANLALAFDPDRSVGVSPTEAAVDVELPRPPAAPQVYNIETEPAASFAAAVEQLPREIQVSSQAQINIQRAVVSTVQQLQYDVRHVPLTRLEIELPTGIATSESLQLDIDGEPYVGEVIRSSAGEDVSKLALDLSPARLGPFTLTVSYRVELSDLEAGAVAASPVSFAVPLSEEATLERSVVAITSGENIQTQLDDKQWGASQTAEDADEAVLALTAQGIPHRVDLLTTYVEQVVPRTILIERMYVQTWLAPRERQDRAVLRIRTNEEAVTAQLPASVKAEQMMVLVDGRDVSARTDENNRLSITLVDDTDAEAATTRAGEFRRHVIEFAWRRRRDATVWNSVSIEVPEVAGAWTKQVRWHVLTPKNRIVVAPPGSMAPEMTNSPWWWMRKPLMNQAELEQWSGASQQASPESSGSGGMPRQYLFSSLGEVEQVTLWSSSAGLAMLLVCGLAFALGAALVYLPQVRHPSVLLAGGMIVGYLAFRWPGVALFAGQTVGLALVVALLSQLAQRLILRRRRTTGQLRRRGTVSRVGHTPSSTRLKTDPAVSKAPSTTATTPASLPLTPSEAP